MSNTTSRLRREQRYCSFCGKERSQTQRMIIGTYGHICDECIVKFYSELHTGVCFSFQPPPNQPSDIGDLK